MKNKNVMHITILIIVFTGMNLFANAQGKNHGQLDNALKAPVIISDKKLVFHDILWDTKNEKENTVINPNDKGY